MMKQQTLGFVAGFLWITSGVARSEASEAPHQTACAIELARSKSPHNYLVAVVERNEPTCDANLCLANLGVIKIISAGDLSLQPASIDVRYSVKGVHKGGEYPKGSSIGVFIPGFQWQNLQMVRGDVSRPSPPRSLESKKRLKSQNRTRLERQIVKRSPNLSRARYLSQKCPDPNARAKKV